MAVAEAAGVSAARLGIGLMGMLVVTVVMGVSMVTTVWVGDGSLGLVFGDGLEELEDAFEGGCRQEEAEPVFGRGGGDFRAHEVADGVAEEVHCVVGGEEDVS